MKKRICILGSTGSIGKSALSLVREHAGSLQIIALAAGKNTNLLCEQIQEFHPEFVSVADEEARSFLLKNLIEMGVPREKWPREISYGTKAMSAMASLDEVDFVLSAVVGGAALLPTLAAIQAGKTVGLANKECLVMAGELLIEEAKKSKAILIPVDSEHSAIFQALSGGFNDRLFLKSIVLTASGGPFWKSSFNELKTITVDQALCHPTWKMGPKITIDSATMANKALEVIEACRLFSLSPDQVKVVVHPQSVVHSLVEFTDGAMLAHLGKTDMKGPIAFSLFYPKRCDQVLESLDLTSSGTLEFSPPDFDRFPCLRIGFEAARSGGFFPSVFNAVNEVAVGAFLKHELSFNGIAQLIEKVIERSVDIPDKSPGSIEAVLEMDQWARQSARDLLKNLSH